MYAPRRIVSVIVPCRDEADYLAEFFRSLERMRVPPHTMLEVLVAEGASRDDTRDRLITWASSRPHVRLLDNPGGLVADGLNRAIREARGEVLIRMDVHTWYADDYVVECLAALASTGADTVGGPWIARGRGFTGNAIALAFGSRFGTGASLSKSATHEGPVDTVYLGCWPRATFERYGLFDPTLVRAQDAELNWRVREAGGLVWQSPRIRSRYVPRSTLRSLFAQYAQYGYWKLRVMMKHPGAASWLYALPALFLLCVIAGAALWPIIGPLPLALSIGAWAMAALGASVARCGRQRAWRLLAVLPLVFATMHVAHGWGFLRSLADVLLGRPHSPRFAAVSRQHEGTEPARLEVA